MVLDPKKEKQLIKAFNINKKTLREAANKCISENMLRDYLMMSDPNSASCLKYSNEELLFLAKMRAIAEMHQKTVVLTDSENWMGQYEAKIRMTAMSLNFINDGLPFVRISVEVLDSVHMVLIQNVELDELEKTVNEWIEYYNMVPDSVNKQWFKDHGYMEV